MRCCKNVRTSGTAGTDRCDHRAEVIAVPHILTGRIGRALADGGAAAVLRLCAMCVSVLAVPILLARLGDAGYGVWLGVQAIYLTAVSLLDLGVGGALVTPLAQALARGDRYRAAELLSTALVVAAAMGALVVVAGSLLAAALPVLGGGLSVLGVPAGQLPWLVAVLSAALGLQLPLSVLTRAMLAMQRTRLAAVCEASGQGLMIVALLSAPAWAGLPGIALAVCAAPLLAAGMQWIPLRPLFGGPGCGIRQALAMAPQAVRRSLPFMLLQGAGIFTLTVDALIANWGIGPNEAAEIGVGQRFFSMVPMAASFVLAPMWPSFAASADGGDWSHVRRAFLVALVLAMATASVVVGCLAWWSAPLMDLWIGPGPRPDAAMLAGYAVWAWIATVGGVPALLLNGLGRFRFQVVCASALIVCSVPAKLLLMGQIGTAGLVWGAVVAQVACVTIPAIVVIALLARRGWHTC